MSCIVSYMLHAALASRNPSCSLSSVSSITLPVFTPFDLQQTLGNCSLWLEHNRRLSGPFQMNWPIVRRKGTQALREFGKGAPDTADVAAHATE